MILLKATWLCHFVPSNFSEEFVCEQIEIDAKQPGKFVSSNEVKLWKHGLKKYIFIAGRIDLGGFSRF